MNKSEGILTIWLIGLSPGWIMFFLAFTGIQIEELFAFILFIFASIALIFVSLLTPSRQHNNIPFAKAGIAIVCVNSFVVYDYSFGSSAEGMGGLLHIILITVLVIAATSLFASNLSGKY